MAKKTTITENIPTDNNQRNYQQLGNVLWKIANELRGTMDAKDFGDYMLSFLFLRYLSLNYEKQAKVAFDVDYPEPVLSEDGRRIVESPISVFYRENADAVEDFEYEMASRLGYNIKPQYLWDNIAELARTQSPELQQTLIDAFYHIENEALNEAFSGLFSEIQLISDKLGKGANAQNLLLCKIISRINDGLSEFSTETDILGNAYEYLIGLFASDSGKKAGEFYTPQPLSTILSKIVSRDSQNPTTGVRKNLEILDFACGSGSLLLNIHNQLRSCGKEVSMIYGQEKNTTTYNLARMNMLLHGLKPTAFKIHNGDSLANDWDLLKSSNKKFDAVVANPPFSLKWEPTKEMAGDSRFINFGLAPKDKADLAFLLHGFHYLKDDGVMAIILPHGALFRGNAEGRIRQQLLDKRDSTDKDEVPISRCYIDTIIGLPNKMFYSTNIPVCILVLKHCKRHDDILFINASEQYEEGKKQNIMKENHIEKIVNTYINRTEEERFSRRVSMDEIRKNGYNLNISRYVSTEPPEEPINLNEVNTDLAAINKEIAELTKKHNADLTALGLKAI